MASIRIIFIFTILRKTSGIRPAFFLNFGKTTLIELAVCIYKTYRHVHGLANTRSPGFSTILSLVKWIRFLRVYNTHRYILPDPETF